jgi:hypothetical protein
MESADLVVLSRFPTTTDAELAKGRLDGAGIDSMIRADNIGGMYPAIGVVELLVRSEDLDEAKDVLIRHARRV